MNAHSSSPAVAETPVDRHDAATVCAQLRQLVGGEHVWPGDDVRAEPCLRDWHGDHVAAALAVVMPANTEQVQNVVRYCAEQAIAVVPQGGNTGLVLGALPLGTDARVIVMGLGRMNAIRDMDHDNYAMTVEAGCILQTVQDAAAAQGFLFPVSLGAEGSCQIGGNISTNAGGVNVLRYGMMREQVLGLEVVLPDGSVLHNLKGLRKDNRGIDVNQFFIGAEGALGIVTAASLRLSPLPQNVVTALLALDSVHDAVQLYLQARKRCGDLMTAFELMPQNVLTLAQEALPDTTAPMSLSHSTYVLVEFSGAELVDVAGVLEGFLEDVMEDGVLQDAVIAHSHTQAATLWRYREAVNEAQALRGLHLRSDVSVSISRMAEFVEQIQQRLQQAFPTSLVVGYGHIGDGNVHVNVLPPAEFTTEQRMELIAAGGDIITECVMAFNGSFSAEHGVGRLKKHTFEHYADAAQKTLMHKLKQCVDPKNIMNPGCLLS